VCHRCITIIIAEATSNQLRRKARGKIATAGKSSTSLPLATKSLIVTRSLGLDVFDNFVGPKLKHFSLHTKLLCSKAPYFEKMMSEDARKSLSALFRCQKIILMPLISSWSGSTWIVCNPSTLPNITPQVGPIFDRIKLYCFAEKHCLTKLMDYTVSSLISNYAKYKKLPTFAVMTYAYQHTAAGSELRSFIAHTIQYIISDLSGLAY
jgi:hypothetical protein